MPPPFSGSLKATPMSKADRLREEIGWMKLLSGLCVGLDTPLIAWTAQNYDAATLIVKTAAFSSILAVTTLLVAVVVNMYRCLKLLETL
jgi:hypothetical protein